LDSLNEVEYKGFDRESLKSVLPGCRISRHDSKTETKQQAIDIIDATSIYQLDDVLVSGATFMVERSGRQLPSSHDSWSNHCSSRAVFIPFDVLEEPLNPVVDWLANPKMKKKTFDAKAAMVSLKWHGIDLQGIVFDLLLASYVANPSTKDELVSLCMAYDYTDIIDPRNLFGRGEKKTIPSWKKWLNIHLKM
jgi:DNA polymerase I